MLSADRRQALSQGYLFRRQGIIGQYGYWLEADGRTQRPSGVRRGTSRAERKQHEQDAEQHFSPSQEPAGDSDLSAIELLSLQDQGEKTTLQQTSVGSI